MNIIRRAIRKRTIRPAAYFIGGMLMGASIFTGYAFKAEETVKQHIETVEIEKAAAVDSAIAEIKEDGKIQYKWYSPTLPEKISFAGEKVPMDRWDVREAFDKQLTINYFTPREMFSILKLSTKYFPIIEKTLAAEGVPDDFKYLCVAESALRNQTSHVGATGYWQFMPKTAPAYGLIINKEVDERLDMERATQAAAKYFKQAHKKFGSWTMAAASYNMGMGGVNKNAKQQYQKSYYDLQLPEETMNYVFRILTFKHIMTQADKFGFVVTAKDAYEQVETKKVTVKSSIKDLAKFAVNHGTSFKVLKNLNPWLRDTKLTVKKGQSFDIDVPVNS